KLQRNSYLPKAANRTHGFKALYSCELLFQWCCDRVGNCFGTCALQISRYLNGWEIHIRQIAYRQCVIGNEAIKQQRQHHKRCHHWPTYKNFAYIKANSI